ncbi:MAG: 50S ribosomal protein L4 [Desulfovibrionaceae bacterium]
MTVATVYSQDKKEAGSIELSPAIFNVDIKPEVLHLVVRSIRASRRSGTHCTKTRSFVSGGGAKPWKQKGTGRARSGSSRSPIWRGGGITFGPQQRDYSFKVNKKILKLAMKMALSSRVLNGNILILKRISLGGISTKSFKAVLDTLEIGKALIVSDSLDNSLFLSARNLKGISCTTVDQLNVYEVLKHKQLVLFEDSVAQIQAKLQG